MSTRNEDILALIERIEDAIEHRNTFQEVGDINMMLAWEEQMEFRVERLIQYLTITLDYKESQ